MTNKSSGTWKEENKVLLRLIGESKIIHNKSTSTVINKLKNDEWIRIAAEYNAIIKRSRTPHQLRLKWQNLKMRSRKCCDAILKNAGAESQRNDVEPEKIVDTLTSPLDKTTNIGFNAEVVSKAQPGPILDWCVDVSGTELRSCNSTIKITNQQPLTDMVQVKQEKKVVENLAQSSALNLKDHEMVQQGRTCGENWCSEEKDVLCQLVKNSAAVLENQSDSADMNIKKVEEWNKVTTRHNIISGNKRTLAEIKGAWKKIKLGGDVESTVQHDFAYESSDEDGDTTQLKQEDVSDNQYLIDDDDMSNSIASMSSVKGNKEIQCIENWSSEEKETLCQLISKSITILEDKSTKRDMSIKLAEEWKNLTTRHNEMVGKERTVSEVIQAWARMKMAAERLKQQQSYSTEGLPAKSITIHDYVYDIKDDDCDTDEIQEKDQSENENLIVDEMSSSFDFASTIQDKKKVRRGENWCSLEKKALCTIISKSLSILEHKSNKRDINIKKAEEWKNVTTRHNRIVGKNRTVTEVMLAWRRIKAAASKLKQPMKPLEVPVKSIITPDYVYAIKDDCEADRIQEEEQTDNENLIVDEQTNSLDIPSAIQGKNKIRRGKSWRAEEKETLRQLISKSISILEDKSAKMDVNRKKAEEWKNITNRHNEIVGKKRKVTEIVLAWRRMKRAAKKKLQWPQFVLSNNDSDSDNAWLQLEDRIKNENLTVDEPSNHECGSTVEDNLNATTSNISAPNLQHQNPEKEYDKSKKSLIDLIDESYVNFKKKSLEMLEKEHALNVYIAELKIKKLELEIKLLQA